MNHLSDRQRESLANLRVGAWATMCCYLDLYQIGTEEEVGEIREDFANIEDPTGYTIWPSLRDALLDMRPDYTTGRELDAQILAEIDARLASAP